MDEIEKRLYHDLKPELELPTKYKNIIREGISPRKKHYSMLKIATATCATLTLAVGIVYAGTTLSNKIWKEPEKVVGFYADVNSNENVVAKEKLEKVIEKEDLLTEQEARERAKKILKQFNRESEKIEAIKLENDAENYELKWFIETNNGTSIILDSRNEDDLNIRFKNTLYKSIEKYHTTREKAEQTARDLCKKYGYDLTEYNHVKVWSNMEAESDSYIWYVNFFKKYDDLVNPYERIDIGFVPEINELYFFTITNSKYENNLIEITKEQAKQSILKVEENINVGYKIKNTDIDLTIARMNGEAYFRATNYEQYTKQLYEKYPLENSIDFRTDNRTRKVWAITLEYDIPESEDNFYKYYSYYVDVTTGEIIGGSSNYYLLSGK